MKKYIIDASVALKWVIEEDGTQEALNLRHNRLLAPDLLVIECANVLWKKVRRQELTGQEAVVIARLLAQAAIQLEPMRPLLEPATKLALALDHPAYDCAYLALAQRENCNLITADLALVRKAQAAGFEAHISRLLSSPNDPTPQTRQ